jgi:hypothetical protein
MNGPEHYAKAEVLLSNAWDHVGKDGPLLHSADVRLALVTAAQAHATLALVAAVVEADTLDTFEVAATGRSGLTDWGKAVRKS